MTDTARNEWLEIYDLIKKTKKLKPWDYLDNLMPVIIADRKKLCFITVMGNGGETYGLIMYDNPIEYARSICHYTRPSDYYSAYMMHHDSISVVWGDKDDLSDDNLKVIKELGLSFRGNWVNIEKHGGGMMPRLLNSAERKKLLKTLRVLVCVCEKFKGCTEMDMAECGCISCNVRRNDIQIEKFEFDIDSIIDKLVFKFDEDDEGIRKLRNMKAKRYSVEVNTYYPPIPNVDENDEDFYTEIFVSANRKTGEICVITENIDRDNEVDFILNSIFTLCREQGKPSEIVVCDKFTMKIIEYFCNAAGIKLTYTDKELEICDAKMQSTYGVMEEVFEMMMNGDIDPNEAMADPEKFIEMFMGKLNAENGKPPIIMTSSSAAPDNKLPQCPDNADRSNITVTSSKKKK